MRPTIRAELRSAVSVHRSQSEQTSLRRRRIFQCSICSGFNGSCSLRTGKYTFGGGSGGVSAQDLLCEPAQQPFQRVQGDPYGRPKEAKPTERGGGRVAAVLARNRTHYQNITLSLSISISLSLSLSLSPPPFTYTCINMHVSICLNYACLSICVLPPPPYRHLPRHVARCWLPILLYVYTYVYVCM